MFAAEPIHAAHAGAYDRALRERSRLLAEESADPVWLTALEGRMAEAGARMAEARAVTLSALQDEIDARGDRPFPQADLGLSGDYEKLAASGAAIAEIEGRLAADLAASRPRDIAAGRALSGPHRTDLAIVHRERGRPAAECSTGEQKALILNLVLAQAARLSRANRSRILYYCWMKLRRISTCSGAPLSPTKSKRSACRLSSRERTKRCLITSRVGPSACVWTPRGSSPWTSE